MELKSAKKIKSIYFLMVFGFIFAALGIIITALNPASKPIDILNVISIFAQFIIGHTIILISKKITKKFFHFFIGLLFMGWSIISFLIAVVLSFTIKEMWPMYGVAAGVALFISGLLKYKAVKFGYGIPSVVLFGMGVWYSLFSMHIIKMSFRTVVATLGPFFMGSVALFLILFFLLQQHHEELVVKDEEIGVFSDEEALFNSTLEDD